MGLLFLCFFAGKERVRHSHAYMTCACVGGNSLSFRDPLDLFREIRITGYVVPIIHSGTRVDPVRPGIHTRYAHGGPDSMNVWSSSVGMAPRSLRRGV